MDRIPHATESIADKAPIVVETATPVGFEGIRTVIQVRMADPGGGFAVDAVINTEVRKGPRGRWANQSIDFQSAVSDHHADLAHQLVAALALVYHGEKDGPPTVAE